MDADGGVSICIFILQETHQGSSTTRDSEIAQQERMMMMAAIIIICLDRCCEPPLHDDRAHLLF
jgi:hypothetical protein